MTLKILPSAFDDLARGRIFYEKQGGAALGEYFFNSLFSDIDSLALFAGIHKMIDCTFYRLLYKRFPYAIYYTLTGETVEIWRVLDCRQQPSTIDAAFE
ncbi:MAG: type II toxin-antitoxin system RelE/ParE family toxin [Verrucomicrobiales bacterium]|nr:type II toxin-antitoxin system RelE/ParE family toxin [Verrucomicrobiales bacterium]